MTKNICFVNNYNNERYIKDCLDSVYAQTTPFDEVILVDDGSTDSSLQLIAQLSSKHENFRLLTKENEGQISTFNFVLPFIPENSQIFLLDGDDIYPEDYLFNALKLMGHETWEFTFCEQQKFIDGEVRSMNTAVIGDQMPYYFPKTTALTRSRGCWIGSPTSCISLSGNVFKKIFPYPCYRDRIVWVDDVMIFATSILGIKKVHLPSLGVGWRSHPNNVTKKHHSAKDIETRKKSIHNIFEWYCTEFNIPRYPGVVEFFREYGQLGKYWQKRLDLPNKYRMLNRLIRNSAKQALNRFF